MAKMELSLGTIAVVAVLVWLFAFGGIGTIGKLLGGQATAPGGGGQIVTTQNGNCPDTLKTAYDGDVINSLDSGAVSYIAALGRFIPDGNFNQYVAFTSGTTAGGGTAIDLRCGKTYKYYLLPAQDKYNPVAPIDFGVVTGSDASRVIQATNFSVLKAKAYDNVARANVYDTVDADASDSDALAVTFTSVTDNATAYTMGVGTTLDWTFDVKTVNTVSYFGNSAEGVYIAVDADKSSYDVPVLQLNGMNLVDVKNSGEISSDDLATLSSYEYIFKVPAGTNIGSATQSVRLYVASKAGQNPSADIVLRFLGKSFYVGNDGFSIYEDIFNRASASELLTATAQTITVDIQ